MSNIAHRQQKIQEKRKKTPWREFVRDICSWYQITFYKNQGQISRYPESDRIGKLLPAINFFDAMTQTNIVKEM
jgi:hypothetical protein